MPSSKCRFLPLLLALWFSPGALGNCPDSSTLHPCTCHVQFDNDFDRVPSTHVTCTNFSSERDLQRVIDRSADYPFPQFILQDVNIPHINSSWFREKRVQFLECSNCLLVSLLESENIEPLPLVSSVTIRSSILLRRVRWQEFRPFVGLWRLYVSGTEVRKLGQRFQEIAHDLEELYLIDTKISNLEGQPFKGKTKLQSIRITNGNIRVLKNSYFEDQKESLTYLSLSNNPIESLPDDIFHGLKELVIVQLEGTRLKTLPRILFDERTHNGRMYRLANNTLECDCKLRWLVTSRRPDNGARGTCHSPPNLRSKPLDQLTRSDFEACDDFIEPQTITPDEIIIMD